MRPQTFGNIRVDTVQELDRWFIHPAELLPRSTPEELQEHLGWLGPRLVEPETGRLILSMHSFLIRTRHHTIMFDTCCGNDKERIGNAPPQPHRWNKPYLENLKRLGVSPEQVDYVMCSHLHYDHVGWNTRLIDGRWVPTFPNAKYIFSRSEYQYWQAAIPKGIGSAYTRAAFGDSVLPIVEHDQALMVDDDHAIGNEFPDEIRFVPMHGHSPHHCGLELKSQSRHALLTGDAVHHPVQLSRPDWVQAPCHDESLAIQTLRNLVERCVDTDTSLLPAHFPTPTAGHVVSHRDGVRFRFDGE